MGKTLKRNKRFWPPKYYRGLTLKQKIQRKKEIERFGAKGWKDPKAYVGFKTDKYAKTKKKSQYTQQWDRMFPNAKTLKERSNVTGVPEKFIKEVYNRGMAAWRTGHRPGQTPQSWSYPRVSSFLLCGKAHYTADADLVREAKAESAKARKWWGKTCKKLTRFKSY
jgi:hypothetical protein